VRKQGLVSLFTDSNSSGGLGRDSDGSTYWYQILTDFLVLA
jgi:hypothetical protein